MALQLPDLAAPGDPGLTVDVNTLTAAVADVDAALTTHDTPPGHVPPDASPLGAVAVCYTDETVGRVIRTWDTVNSRWQITYGDTGWRDVSASRGAGWSGGTLYLRRMGYTVALAVVSITGASSLSTLMYALPTGFVPASGVYPLALSREGSLTGEVFGHFINGASVGAIGMTVQGAPHAAGNTYDFYISFITGDAWPASLPGTASGSIPTGFHDDAPTLLPSDLEEGPTP